MTEAGIWGKCGSYINSDGEEVRYFACDCSDDAVIARMIACEEEYGNPYEQHRDFERNLRRLSKHDGYRVRHKRVKHLGHRVNLIPSTAKVF